MSKYGSLCDLREYRLWNHVAKSPVQVSFFNLVSK